MGHKKVSARRQARRKVKKERIVKALAGNIAYVVLGGAVLLFAVALVVATQHIPSGTAEGSDAATQVAATANAGSGWITLSSNSSSGVIEAARKTTLFTVNRSSGGDYLSDLSHLELPVFVRAIHPAGSVVLPDYYIIPIDDASGQMVGAAELALNPTHTAVQLTAIITYTTPRPHGEITRGGKALALSALASQRHVAMRRGAHPRLVYLPIDASALQTGQITWNGGGQYPADPVWLISGADGHDYVVGSDGHAYAMSDLPVMKQP